MIFPFYQLLLFFPSFLSYRKLIFKRLIVIISVWLILTLWPFSTLIIVAFSLLLISIFAIIALLILFVVKLTQQPSLSSLHSFYMR